MNVLHKKYRRVISLDEKNQSQTNFSQTLGKVVLSSKEKNKIYNDFLLNSIHDCKSKETINYKYDSISDNREKEISLRKNKVKEVCEKNVQEIIYSSICLCEFCKEMNYFEKFLINKNVFNLIIKNFINFIFSPLCFFYIFLCHISGFINNVLGGYDAFSPIIIRKLGRFLGGLIAIPYKVISIFAPLLGCLGCIVESIISIPLSLIMRVREWLVGVVTQDNTSHEGRKSFLSWDPVVVSLIIHAKYELFYLRNGGEVS